MCVFAPSSLAQRLRHQHYPMPLCMRPMAPLPPRARCRFGARFGQTSGSPSTSASSSLPEDSTRSTTERSSNAETLDFEAECQVQLNIVAKNFKENETGMEYIGRHIQ